MDHFTLLAQTGAEVSRWPLFILVLSIVMVVLLITVARLHAFLALILAALTAGMLAERLEGAKPRVSDPTAPIVAPSGKPLKNHYVRAVELTTSGFGKTAGGVGLVIGLATIISMCLMESGAADKVVRRFLAFFGEKHAGLALLLSTYVLSIPIFFDTMFMLMVPLAKALQLRTGKNYLLYVLAVCCGGLITHCLTVPHPGPSAMIENLRIDAGQSILMGILVGIIPLFIGFWVCVRMNSKWAIPLRDTPGTTMADLNAIVDKSEDQLPSFFWSILPVILPIALISLASFFLVARENEAIISALGGASSFDTVYQFVELLGDKNIALLIGTFLSMYGLARQKGHTVAKIGQLIGPPLETAGTIILITSAGGAFGAMLRNAGVGEAINAVAQSWSINLIVLAYVVSVLIRLAQGSATVAMITTSAMIWPIISPTLGGAELGYHPVYIMLAIGWGSFACSWMNDSGFWVVCRLSGMTERETLKSFSVMLTIVSFAGLIVTFLLSKILPFTGVAWPVGG